MHLHRLFPLALTAALAATSSAPLMAQTTPQQEAAIDKLMSRYDGRVPGASLLVLKDGRPAVRKSWGYADLQHGVRATPKTNYRLASVSKQFTAATILLLAEDGRLSVDDPVRKWLPTLPPATQDIRIRHLLSHTSGLIDYEDVMDADQQRQLHDADVLKLLETQDKLYFPPGTDYRYSNSAYCLLSLIAEKASGQPFPALVKSRIFDKLGMDASVVHVEGEDTVANRAYGNSEIDGKWVRTDQSPTSATLGDGGVYSSIDDLAKWDAALYDERLLKASSLHEAFSPKTRTPEPDVPYYGYGWRINGDALWHSGETIGGRNVILRYPKERLTVILLSNRNDPEPYRIALQIAALFRNPGEGNE
ncbi:MAG: serine hydrolase domain-containing protein [Pseudoxanthomonas sp.]